MKNENIVELMTPRKDFIFPVLDGLVGNQTSPKLSVNFSSRKDRRPGKKASRVSLLLSRQSEKAPYALDSISFSKNGFPKNLSASVVTEFAADRLAGLYDTEGLKDGEVPEVRVDIADSHPYHENTLEMRGRSVDQFLMGVGRTWSRQGVPTGEMGAIMELPKEQLLEAKISGFEDFQNYLRFVDENKLYRDTNLVLGLSARKRDKPGTKADKVYVVLGKDFSQIKPGIWIGDLPYMINSLHLPKDFLEGKSFEDVRIAAMEALHKIGEYPLARLRMHNYSEASDDLVRLDLTRDQTMKNSETNIEYETKKGMPVRDFNLDAARRFDENGRSE